MGHLEQMAEIGGLEPLIKVATQAVTPEIARFMRRRIELLAVMPATCPVLKRSSN